MEYLKLDELCKNLTGNELKLYFILRKNCNANLECKRSIRSIAIEYGLSPRTVNLCIDNLVAKKYIQKIKRVSSDGLNLTNLYKIIGGI